MRNCIKYLFIGLLCMVWTCLSGAPNFPERLDHGEIQYVKTNSHSVKAFGFIKLLTACLYVGEGYDLGEYPAPIPIALRLQYDRNFKKGSLVGSADKVLRDQYSSEQLNEIRQELESINSVYVDVKKGDEYTLVYHPALGTTLYFNGNEEVTIPGQQFAEIYFSIWLGNHPDSQKLSQQLLKKTTIAD